MKQLLRLAAVTVFAVALTATAQAQQAAPKPAADKPVATAQKATAVKAAPAKQAKTKFTAAQIKEAQTGLQKQKLYTGKINGVWSASTVKAYKAWEKANNMPETGVLTDSTLAKLKQ